MTFIVWAAGVIVMVCGLMAVEVHQGIAVALLVLGGALCQSAGNALQREWE